MKFDWKLLIGGLISAVIGMLNLPAPLADLLQKLFGGLFQDAGTAIASLAAVGGTGAVIYAGGKGLMTGRAHAAAKRLRQALMQARDAADDLGGVPAEFTTALSAAEAAVTPVIDAALKKERKKKPQPESD